MILAGALNAFSGDIFMIKNVNQLKAKPYGVVLKSSDGGLFYFTCVRQSQVGCESISAVSESVSDKYNNINSFVLKTNVVLLDVFVNSFEKNEMSYLRYLIRALVDKRKSGMEIETRFFTEFVDYYMNKTSRIYRLN